MAIRTVVTRGFGNGTFNGTIPLVVTRGYAIGEAAAVVGPACLTAVYVASPEVTAVNLAVPSVTDIHVEACE